MEAIPLSHVLGVAAVLFGIGFIGVLTRRNVLIVLMSIEIMLNAGNLTLIAFSRYNTQMEGHVLVFFVIAIAAAEVAVGLAMVLAFFRLKRSVHLDELKLLRH